jgi:hypothetical protein
MPLHSILRDMCCFSNTYSILAQDTRTWRCSKPSWETKCHHCTKWTGFWLTMGKEGQILSMCVINVIILQFYNNQVWISL